MAPSADIMLHSQKSISIANLLVPDLTSEPDLENIGYLQNNMKIRNGGGNCTHL